MQDFESEAIKAITQAGLTIDNPDDAMHVRVVKFLSGRAMYSLSFTDIDGIDYTCPMCQGAILWSGIGMVVYGTSILFLRSQGWRQIDIVAEEVVRRSPSWRCTLVGGVLEQECNALFEAAKRRRVVDKRNAHDRRSNRNHSVPPRETRHVRQLG